MPTLAFAGDATGNVQCDQNNPQPGCTVDAGTPGGSGASGGGGHSAGDGVCHRSDGVEMPCQSSDGTAGSDGCYYRPADPSELSAEALGGAQGPAAWYIKTCPGENLSSQSIVFLAEPPVVTPEVLARQARSMLWLPQVMIALNPAGDQLVGLPTWLSLDGGSWTSQSATASVPGVSVTATATPVRATWQLGDGSIVECFGPGTRWRPGMDPAAMSPDCGYRYRFSSAGQPGAAYTVSVSVTWDVSWAGAGQAGAVAGLTTVGTASVRVAESQAVLG